MPPAGQNSTAVDSVPFYTARFRLLNVVFDVFGHGPAEIGLRANLPDDLRRALLPIWPSEHSVIWWPPVTNLDVIGGVEGLAAVPLVGVPTIISPPPRAAGSAGEPFGSTANRRSVNLPLADLDIQASMKLEKVTGWAARRGPVPGVGAGLFRAASLRTQQAFFNALGSPVTVPRSRRGWRGCSRGRGGRR
jgi:hypothetical protein